MPPCIATACRSGSIWDVPRLGGAAVLLGMVASWAQGMVQTWQGRPRRRWDWGPGWGVAAGAAAFGRRRHCRGHDAAPDGALPAGLHGGFGVLAVALLGLAVPRLDLPWPDMLLANAPWIGFAIALLAVAGLPHAFNIIDGFNGLAGMVALIVCLALAHVALQVATGRWRRCWCPRRRPRRGFWCGTTRGMLFAGDGGAYIWGVVIALASVSLVQRNVLVSPWFPLLLLDLPGVGNHFSIYRKLVRGVSPGVADALHFHQLIYRRIVRSVFHDDESRRMLMRNNRTSPYLWGFTLLTVVPAVLFWNRTPVLMVFCALFVVSYVAAYLAIVRFKVPTWLRR